MASYLTPVLASTTPYSPFADITLNTHWDSQYGDLEPVDLYAISKESGIKSFNLAFITDAGNCNPAWGGYSAYSVNVQWGSHTFNKLHENNIPYIISFGGQAGNDLSQSCSASELTAAYEKVIQTYSPSGIDFDIENGSVNITKLIQSVSLIQQAHPQLNISFTLPVLPEGLVAEGKVVVQKAKNVNLNFSVNLMAMDYGPGYVNDMGEYAILAATNLFQFLKNLYPEKSDAALWKMVQVTLMIGVNDVSIEEFTLNNVDTLRNFADLNHLGGLSIWSISRDKPCSDRWTSSLCSSHDLQSKPYEYSERFMQ